MRDVNSDQQGRQHLADRSDGIDETRGAPMQFIGNCIENRHAGHKDVGPTNKDAHQSNRKHQSSFPASCKHRVNKAEKCQYEEFKLRVKKLEEMKAAQQ